MQIYEHSWTAVINNPDIQVEVCVCSLFHLTIIAGLQQSQRRSLPPGSRTLVETPNYVARRMAERQQQRSLICSLSDVKLPGTKPFGDTVRESGRQLWRHSVTESDTESHGYASISFSDSDTGSETPDTACDSVSRSVKEDTTLTLTLARDTAVEDDTDKHFTNSSQALKVQNKKYVEDTVQAVDAKPRAHRASGYVGFSCLPDQVL